MPQAFNAQCFCERVIMALAASYSAVRTSPSPRREMCPSLSTDVPDWMRFGVRPKWAPTVFDLAKRTGSSMAERHRGDRADTRNTTQPAKQFVTASELNEQRVQLAVFVPQYSPAPQHALGRALEQRIAGDQRADP